MAFPVIRTSTSLAVVIIILCLLISGFLLLFGVANLIQPDVPDAYLAQNTRTCLVICFIGLLPLLFVIASFRGILQKKKNSVG